MHFLIHLPDCTPADLQTRAKACGLLHLLGGHDVLPVHPGPGGTGLMVGWLSPQAPLMNYDAAGQEWVPSIQKDEHGKPVYWAGFWKDKAPKENELRRHYTQAGPLVQLGETKWKLPTPDTVDSRAVYADDGAMKWEVIRQFSWVCDEAEQLRQQYLEDFGIRSAVFRVDPSAQVGWLLKLLQINYRITPEVAVHLDLWVGKEHLLDVFLTTLGLTRKQADG
jgi:hypothetical protein